MNGRQMLWWSIGAALATLALVACGSEREEPAAPAPAEPAPAAPTEAAAPATPADLPSGLVLSLAQFVE